VVALLDWSYFGFIIGFRNAVVSPTPWRLSLLTNPIAIIGAESVGATCASTLFRRELEELVQVGKLLGQSGRTIADLARPYIQDSTRIRILMSMGQMVRVRRRTLLKGIVECVL
jgi:hypothetical protein